MANTPSMDQALIEKLNNILEVNLDKEHFGVKELAQEIGLSRSQLNRKLQSVLGKSTSRFIREYRLEKAMKMLQKNEATAAEIAYRVGFNSPTYFNTCFNEFYGYPPGEAKLRNINEEKQVIPKTFSEEVKGRIKITRFFNRRLVWLSTIAVLLLSVLGYSLYKNYTNSKVDEIAIIENQDKSIAILPFKNLGLTQQDEFFAIGITSSLQSQLNKVRGLILISERCMEKYKNSIESPSEIAKQINVRYLLDGSYLRYKDSIRVTVNLIDAKNDRQLIAMVFPSRFDNLFALQSDIAKEVALNLNMNLTKAELAHFDEVPTTNQEAFNYYLKGRFFLNKYTREGINKSIQYFNMAIELDSTYALAYAGLADAYFESPEYLLQFKPETVYNLSKEYAEKALSINNNLAQAHATLGRIYCYKDWNWEDSEKEFKLAIKLEPNYAPAHQYYAELLQILCRRKEARREINYAIGLNPNSYRMSELSAWMYVDDGQFAKAISEANKALEFDEERSRALFIKTACYSYWGKEDEFFKAWEEEIEKSSNRDLALENKFRDAFKKSGIYGFWKFYTDNLIKTNNANKMPVHMAATLASIGENEQALKWLEIAYKNRDNALIRKELIHTKYLYNYKHLRKNPKFLEILDKLNLGGYE